MNSENNIKYIMFIIPSCDINGTILWRLGLIQTYLEDKETEVLRLM
jgi:hypothetical protein